MSRDPSICGSKSFRIFLTLTYDRRLRNRLFFLNENRLLRHGDEAQALRRDS